MVNLDHPQFSKEFNRIFNAPVIETRHPRVEQRPVDPEDPYRPIHTGVYTDSAPDNSGRERKYLFCVPSSVQPSGNTVFVFGSAGQTPEELFEQGNWREKLEKYRAAGCFVVPDGDWNREEPGAELDWFLRVYTQMRDLEYYASNLDSIYVIGLGTGAYMAGVYALLYGSIVASCALAGSCSMDPRLLARIGELPSDGDPFVKKSENPLPGWILDADGTGLPVAEFLKGAVGVQEEQLRNDVAQVWRQRPKAGTLYLNEQPVSEVWYSDREQLDALSPDELADRLLKFVTGYKRWGGTGNRHIRRSKLPQEMNLIRREIVCDGRKRHWFVYEPTAYRRGLKKEYPLVLAIHGFSCSGAFYAENSSWEAVAEERGVLVAFPTAYPFHRTARPGPFSYAAPTPAWNCQPDLEKAGEAPDDVKFLTQVVETMKRDYPVDDSRVYATGHSNGSVMTQCLLRYAPQHFAAFGAIGAMEGNWQTPVPLPGELIRPVWYIMGEFDGKLGWTIEPGNANDVTIRNACRTDHADFDHASRYVSGIYHHIVAYNEDRVPLVRFTGVAGWPHTVSPETSLMLYDEFFSKFTRDPDGTSRYLG